MVRTQLLPLLLLVACGGSSAEASPSVRNLPSFEVANGIAAPGISTLPLDLRLAGPLQNAVLVEFQLEYDVSRFRPVSGRSALEAKQGLPDLDGEENGSGIKIVCGDARNPSAQRLQEGDLLRLWLDVLPPRTLGDCTIHLRNVRMVDAAGAVIPVNPTAAIGRITVQ